MTPREAEKLLGGYAAGILTDDERRALFEAAMRHQPLFDALADEEALRLLLADPNAKAQLLQALAQPTARVVPFYRSLPFLGAAASLLMAATAGIAYLRSPEAQRREAPATPQPPPSAPPLPSPASAAPPPTREASPKPAPPVKKVAPPPATRELERGREAQPAPLQLRDAAAPAAPPAPEPAPSSVSAGAASGAVADKVATEGRLEQNQAARAKKSMKEEKASKTRGDGFFALGGVASAARPAYATPSQPVWTVEHLAGGQVRVTVRWSEPGHLILLRRTDGPATSVAPAMETRGGEGARVTEFRLSLGAGDALDLYLLSEAPADPARLPAGGPISGFRRRIHPTGD